MPLAEPQPLILLRSLARISNFRQKDAYFSHLLKSGFILMCQLALYADGKRTKLITRRAILVGVMVGLLSGCTGGENVDFRFRTIVRLIVDGTPREFTNVMELKIARVTHSLIGMGGSSMLSGEALRIDLGSRGNIYVLPLRRYADGQISYEFFDWAVPKAFGIKNGLGSLSDQDYKDLRLLNGRKRLSIKSLPTFVAFTNENEASSLYQLDPWDIERRFPGVHFISVDVEITDAPITEELGKHLPWLVNLSEHTAFPRDPPGHQRPMRESPIAYVMLEEFFFGKGSRPYRPPQFKRPSTLKLLSRVSP
ncbi:hypothetical protein [Rhizobium sp. R86522]|uniref:hypothetical protein n=1 Tax=Rhizobium sp. R86522 TaxID=3093861 RepID=UPI00367310BC